MPRIAALLTLVLAATLVAGCAKFDAALGKREAVVQFTEGTSNAARMRVRAACSHVPNATPEPLPTNHLMVNMLYDVRFVITNASDGDVARLQTCLARFPSFQGLEFNDAGGD